MDLERPETRGDVGALEPDAAEQALLAKVTDALLVLANVEFGDYSTRLEVEEDSELAELFSGINDMVEALQSERQRSVEYQEDLEAKLEMIEEQRAAIRELSTPILEVWDGVLCLPVIGVIDTVRSSEMTSELLEAIATKRAQCAIIDITGIEVMDTSTAEHFIRMAKSARLLGSQCVLTGINPNIAQTIVHMGIELGGIVTYRNLRDALRQVVAQQQQARRNRRRRR